MNMNRLFISTFSTLVFLGILLNITMSENIGIVMIILLILLFFPLISLGLWQGMYGFIPIFLTIVIVFFYDNILSYFLLFLFVIPSVIITYATKKISKSYGDSLCLIVIYTAFLVTSALIYLNITYDYKSIHTYFYDTLTFVSLIINQSLSGELDKVKDLSNHLDIIAFILPAIVGIIFLLWFTFNYRLAISLALKANIINDNKLVSNYFLPKYYTYLSILFIIITLLVHNFLDNNANVYYILYNVLFILCFGFFYSGFEFVWKKVKTRNSLLVTTIFILSVIVLFTELVLIFSFVGFILELKRINTQS